MVECNYPTIFTSCIETLLVNHLKACVRNKHLRDADALRGLVVLKQCCNDAWQGKRRAVESVSKLGLLLIVLIAELEAVCLERLEV